MRVLTITMIVLSVLGASGAAGEDGDRYEKFQGRLGADKPPTPDPPPLSSIDCTAGIACPILISPWRSVGSSPSTEEMVGPGEKLQLIPK